MNIYIKTFGCTANKSDSLKIKQAFLNKGHRFTDNFDTADTVIVNTCTVTQTTQRKVIKYIKSISGKRVLVTGCMALAQPEVLKDIKCKIINQNTLSQNIQMIDGITGIVGISNGCVGNCSYCIVKKARGNLISRSISDIMYEVKQLINQGAKEIQITSQDTAAFGIDKNEKLYELLNAITSIDADFMVRVGMMNPFTLIGILDEVIKSFKNPHIFKFLHLPVQSGSNRVLKDMNRNYKVEDFKYIVNKFKENFKELTLSTDFIVGYPTEEEKDFQDSLKLIDEIKPQKVNITQYSERRGTESSKLYDMPQRIKKQRSRIMTKKQTDICQRIFSKKIGEKTRILITEKGKNKSVIGRDMCYNNIVVKSELNLGKWYDVKIIDSKTFYLVGELIE